MKKEKREYLKGIFRAEHKNARVSPKKARDVARAIQGMRVDDAIKTVVSAGIISAEDHPVK